MVSKRKSHCPIGRGPKVILAVTGRELATILAALRGYQDENAPDKSGGRGADRHLHEIATDGGKYKAMSKSQIDQLCQRLNLGPHPALAIDPPPLEARPWSSGPPYRVVYQIDLNATSTREAARETWETIKESEGPIFQVIDQEGNVVDEDFAVAQEGDPDFETEGERDG